MTYAFIPLRAGSKGIPGKNTKNFLGKPLWKWVVDAAISSDVDRVVISTDIEGMDKMTGGKIVVGKRTGHTCDDEATTEEVLMEWVRGNLASAAPPEGADDVIVILQATSPYTTALDINNVIDRLDRRTYDSILSAAPMYRFYWEQREDYLWQPANYTIALRPRRQDMEPVPLENGAMYASRLRSIRESGARISGRIGISWMAYSFELDTPEDWIIGEAIMGEHGGH